MKEKNVYLCPCCGSLFPYSKLLKVALKPICFQFFRDKKNNVYHCAISGSPYSISLFSTFKHPNDRTYRFDFDLPDKWRGLDIIFHGFKQGAKWQSQDHNDETKKDA